MPASKLPSKGLSKAAANKFRKQKIEQFSITEKLDFLIPPPRMDLPSYKEWQQQHLGAEPYLRF